MLYTSRGRAHAGRAGQTKPGNHPGERKQELNTAEQRDLEQMEREEAAKIKEEQEMAQPKPGVIVFSTDDDTEGFKWMSDGWNEIKKPHENAEQWMRTARQHIEAGENVPDVIRRLTEAGFNVTRG